MFKQINARTLKLTRELATEFSTMPQPKGERQLNPARLKWLEAKLADGHFYTPKWATAKLNGTTFRVNGQHSSYLLANLDDVFPKGMFAQIDEFICDTEPDLADLYAQFDPSGSKRTPGDIVGAHGKIHAELMDITPTAMVRAVDGIAFADTDGGRSGTYTMEEKARLVHDNIDFICWVSKFVHRRMMHKIGTVAAMYATYSKSTDIADEFWMHVREESHPDNKNASRRYARFLREAVKVSIMGKRSQYSTRAFYVKAIHAWNAYRKDQDSDLKFFTKVKTPKIK